VQFDLQNLGHVKRGAIGPMVCHSSCALPSRSAIATRIAVRLWGLTTAINKRTHPIVSYLRGDLRFIGFRSSPVPFTLNKGAVVLRVRRSHFLRRTFGLGRTKEVFISTLLRATRTLIAINPRISNDWPARIRLRSKSPSSGPARKSETQRFQYLCNVMNRVARNNIIFLCPLYLR
jgi:hypothetical protein